MSGGAGSQGIRAGREGRGARLGPAGTRSPYEAGGAREATNPNYTRHHPKWYRPRTPIFWWLRGPAYTKFIARELTSVFVAYTAVLLLVHAWAAGQGGEAYEGFRAWLERPGVVAFHGLVLLALLFHTVTWLNLAPKALVVKVGRRHVPQSAILLGHYGAWVVATVVVIWLLVGGGS